MALFVEVLKDRGEAAKAATLLVKTAEKKLALVEQSLHAGNGRGMARIELQRARLQLGRALRKADKVKEADEILTVCKLESESILSDLSHGNDPRSIFLTFVLVEALDDLLKDFLQHCVAFDEVESSADFVKYIKRCQIDNSLFFNGSNDKPLPEQLKALYVKQAFVHFSFLSQHFRYEGQEGAGKLQVAFKRFVKLIQIDDTSEPSWPVAAAAAPEIEKSIRTVVDGAGEAGS